MKSRAPSGRRLDQRRRLDLDEAVRVVDLADRLDHPAAEQQPVGHRLAPDVEVAVLEAQALVDRGVGLVDVERRRLRLGQDLDLGRPQLDLAGRQLRVLGARQARRDLAGDSTTNSSRTRLAIACASGASVSSMTTWVMPCRSRRSRKISWPWSRRRWTQPASAPWSPASALATAPRCGCDRAWRGWGGRRHGRRMVPVATGSAVTRGDGAAAVTRVQPAVTDQRARVRRR